MKFRKLLYILAAGAALPCLFFSLAVFPARAADEAGLYLDPSDGEIKIGDKIEVAGRGFNIGVYYYLYFSSDKAVKGNTINTDVTHYVLLEKNIKPDDETSPTPGDFDTFFIVPDLLGDGEDVEDVHGGEYYVYAVYRTTKEIKEIAAITIYGGEIELSPEESTVGSEIEISGEGLRPNQKIELECDDYELDITGGDTLTDANGEFNCSVAVPEKPAGEYILTVIDESGNKPEATFSIIPRITVSPVAQEVDGQMEISGTGFAYREPVTVSLDGTEVGTTPFVLHTNRLGSLGGSFIVPPRAAFTDGKTVIVQIRDESYNTAETELDVLPITATISLSPDTSRIEPGHAGMELTVSGIWFVADATLDITFDNGETHAVTTARVTESRNFSVSFTVPPGSPGSYMVTASDGTNSVSDVFTMESEKPLTPAALLPEVMTTAEAETYFDWKSVADPSGVIYVLQISADTDFTTILLEKTGLVDSEYTLTGDEKLAPTGSDAPYYWRVKAVDGTSIESDWSTPFSFYIGAETVLLAGQMKYLWVGIAAAVAAVVIIRVRKGRIESAV